MIAIRNEKSTHPNSQLLCPGAAGAASERFSFLLNRILYQSNYSPERRDYAYNREKKFIKKEATLRLSLFTYALMLFHLFVCTRTELWSTGCRLQCPASPAVARGSSSLARNWAWAPELGAWSL